MRRFLQHHIRNKLLCLRYILVVKWHLPKNVVVGVLVRVDKALVAVRII